MPSRAERPSAAEGERSVKVDPTTPPSAPAPAATPQDATTPLSAARPRTHLPPAFSPHQVVAGRYRIVRFIAHGATGEVYEADDLEVRGRVALKTVRAEIPEHRRSIERLRREIHLARKVTHPNVCRTFDIGHHGETTFLTMEFLAGETLAQRIRRTGAMRPEEALPLLRQMVAALTAAHQAGIIHRDFKSANVMLVPSVEGTRAVVTDFGLARGIATESGAEAWVTGAGDVVGTPAYMAPEQVEGGEVTAAADIYALGVVMYEMVTATWPFVGETALSTAAKRLKHDPPPPRTRVDGLDPRWDAAILRCLERDPARRFASALDVLKAVLGEWQTTGAVPAAALPEAAQTEGRALQRLSPAAVGLALLGVALVVASFFLLRSKAGPAAPRETPSAASSAKPRRSVAVLGFKNLSGRPAADWLSVAFGEMLSTELAADERVRVIAGENVARAKVELSLGEADGFARDTLARIRKNLGTDYVVAGSYAALGKESGGQVRLDLKLQDASSGETVAAVAEQGAEAQLFDMISRAGARVRERLGLGSLSAAEVRVVRSAVPGTPSSVRLYSEGLARLRLFDALAARDYLEKAVAADPQYPLAHAALAAAWSVLGYDRRARAEAGRAFDLAGGLPRAERLSVEGRYRETAREWEKAIQIYRTLWKTFPDDLDHGLRLAAVQTSAGKGRKALETLETLRGLPAPASSDPRIDLAEAAAAESLSNSRRQQAAAARAAAKGDAQGARLLVARARVFEARALRRLGELPRAMAACESAHQTYAEAGDRQGVAWALNNIADVFRDQGDLRRARELQEQSLAACREIGDRSGVARALSDIAVVLRSEGEISAARMRFEESLAVYRELGDRRGVAKVLNNLAEVLREEGEAAAARKMYEESLALDRSIGDKRGAASVLGNLANLLAERGDLPAAQKMGEESLAIRREVGDKKGVAEALIDGADVLHERGDFAGARRALEEVLGICREIGNRGVCADALRTEGELLVAEGKLAEARARHEEALRVESEIGERGDAAESRIALAALAVEQGHATEATSLAREALEEFRAERRIVGQASAQVVLARALLAEKKPAEARRAIDRASLLAARSGCLKVRLEARLAQGELELGVGNASSGRARLAAVEREASAKSFAVIARRAAALRAR